MTFGCGPSDQSIHIRVVNVGVFRSGICERVQGSRPFNLLSTASWQTKETEALFGSIVAFAAPLPPICDQNLTEFSLYAGFSRVKIAVICENGFQV